jgi:hypothetical protein
MSSAYPSVERPPLGVGGGRLLTGALDEGLALARSLSIPEKRPSRGCRVQGVRSAGGGAVPSDEAPVLTFLSFGVRALLELGQPLAPHRLEEVAGRLSGKAPSASSRAAGPSFGS